MDIITNWDGWMNRNHIEITHLPLTVRSVRPFVCHDFFPIIWSSWSLHQPFILWNACGIYIGKSDSQISRVVRSFSKAIRRFLSCPLCGPYLRGGFVSYFIRYNLGQQTKGQGHTGCVCFGWLRVSLATRTLDLLAADFSIQQQGEWPFSYIPIYTRFMIFWKKTHIKVRHGKIWHEYVGIKIILDPTCHVSSVPSAPD